MPRWHDRNPCRCMSVCRPAPEFNLFSKGSSLPPPCPARPRHRMGTNRASQQFSVRNLAQAAKFLTFAVCLGSYFTFPKNPVPHR